MARGIDPLHQAQCPGQYLGVVRSVVILGQRVDGKGLPINALLGVDGPSLEIDHPVIAAKLAVPEEANEILIGAASGGEIHRVAINVEGLREGPQNARIQDKSLGGARIDRQVIGNLAAKTVKLVVDGVLEPKGQDVREQLRFHLPP